MTLGHEPVNGIPRNPDFKISGLWHYMDIRLPDMGMFACSMTPTRHGVCYLSRKPGRSPQAPETFESKQISIFYLTRKGSDQASDSNIIPHALSESSGMQKSPYPAIG